MRRARGPLFVMSAAAVAVVTACATVPSDEVLAPEKALVLVSSTGTPRHVDLWLDARVKAATYARLEAERVAAEQAAAVEAERIAVEAHAVEHHAAEHRRADARAAAAAAEVEAAPPPRRRSAPSSSSSPAPSSGGGTNAHLARIKACESGGNYGAVSGSGRYRGAYQFSRETWAGVGGTGDPADASPAEQDRRAQMLYDRSGSGQWPVCQRR